MTELTLNHFARHVGERYAIEAGGNAIHLTLAEAQELPASGRAGGSFRLEFRGPLDPILPQATYRFSRGRDAADIFIVPIGRDPKGTRYEAIFF